MNVAVVGHVEWVEFVRVKALPKPGEIVHASETWEEAAGGGSVAAVQLAKLAGACTLLTALGDDERGRKVIGRLEPHGVRVECAWRNEEQRRGITFIDDDAERTITVIGKRHQLEVSDEPKQLANFDGVYFTAGAPEVLRDRVRQAPVVVATARVLPILERAGVVLDAIVRSARDVGEPDPIGRVRARLVAVTEGANGGAYTQFDESGGRVIREGRWNAAPLPGPPVDAYGCGDSFAAGLTFALASKMNVDDALSFAAKCGAHSLTGRGPFGGQLELRRGHDRGSGSG